MDQSRIIFQCLDQIRHKRIFEQCRHRSRRMHVARMDGRAVSRIADNNIAQAPL